MEASQSHDTSLQDLETSCELLKTGFYESLEQKTAWLTQTLQEFCDQKGYDMSFPRIGSIFWPTFTRMRIKRADEIDASRMELFKKMHLACLERGVYFGPSGYEVGFVSAAHTMRDLEFAADKIMEAIDIAFGN